MVKKEEDYVKNLRHAKNIISQFAVISKEIKKTRQNKPYLNLTLQDKTGQINAKMFSNNTKKHYDKIELNKIYNIIGNVREYPENSGRFNILIDDFRPSKKFNEDDFKRQAEDYESHIEYFFNAIKNVKNPDLKKILKSFFQDETIRNKFLIAPAAKIHHHNYKGGLLVHTNEVIEICKTLTLIYQELDPDLLITGAILHDIGKIETYDFNENIIEINSKGKLLDHIFIGANLIEEKISRLDINDEIKIKLIHMILSHHGPKDLGWGSTISPQTPEALALHHADDMSAKISGLLSKNSNQKI